MRSPFHPVPCRLVASFDLKMVQTQILSDPLKFGDEFTPEARSILTGLLTRDPAQRLGANGAQDIKRHPFFANNIDFKKLMAKAYKPPFKPNVESAADTSNVSGCACPVEPVLQLTIGVLAGSLKNSLIPSSRVRRRPIRSSKAVDCQSRNRPRSKVS